VVVLNARSWGSWLAVVLHVLLRRSEATDRVLRRTFAALRIDLDRPHLWELDGEVMGRTRQLVINIQPGALTVRVPSEVSVGETA
jgi:diacylglycerol kinase family enzyme